MFGCSMSASELKSKLQLELNRREIFERRAAELEVLNDQLRGENDVSLRTFPAS